MPNDLKSRFLKTALRQVAAIGGELVGELLADTTKLEAAARRVKNDPRVGKLLNHVNGIGDVLGELLGGAPAASEPPAPVPARAPSFGGHYNIRRLFIDGDRYTLFTYNDPLEAVWFTTTSRDIEARVWAPDGHNFANYFEHLHDTQEDSRIILRIPASENGLPGEYKSFLVRASDSPDKRAVHETVCRTLNVPSGNPLHDGRVCLEITCEQEPQFFDTPYVRTDYTAFVLDALNNDDAFLASVERHWQENNVVLFFDPVEKDFGVGVVNERGRLVTPLWSGVSGSRMLRYLPADIHRIVDGSVVNKLWDGDREAPSALVKKLRTLTEGVLFDQFATSK